jgi:hypothetical protein
MILAELPRLHRAIELLGLDNGADPISKATIPPDWETRARIAEDELLRLTPAELEDLVYGEESDQKTVAPRAPAVDEILNAAFDSGELAELFFEPWRNIFDARAAEARQRSLKK